MVVPTQWFGGNSDGGMAMEEWLYDYCQGCRFESVKERRERRQGGMGCPLPGQAYAFPYDDLESWSADAGDGVTDLVCMKRETRPLSPLKGKKTGKRIAASQQAMF